MNVSERLAQAKRQIEAQQRFEALMKTGKFTDTGAKYSADQATADHDNPALRLTAKIDGSTLVWGK